MASINTSATISSHFGVSADLLDELGVLDATLAIDTQLFIDPLLLEESSHSEISESAVEQYEHHFDLVIRFLSRSKREGDVAWRSAYNLLTFHEITGTCLGI